MKNENVNESNFSTDEGMDVEAMNELLALTDAPFRLRADNEQTRARLLDLVKNNERYEGFTVLNVPVPFWEFAEGYEIDFVQLHDTTPLGDENPNKVVGFCGVCSWKGNELVSLDGDSYSDEMLVYGYEWFTNEGEGIEKGLDILVKEW